MENLENIDEDEGDIVPGLRRVRIDLRSAAKIGMEMAKIYRMARANKLPVDQASKLMHMLAVISRQFSESELERRVSDLEKAKAL